VLATDSWGGKINEIMSFSFFLFTNINPLD